MKYDPDTHHRRTIRLQEYDYSQEGMYFVTMCAEGRECLFGDIVDGKMRPNDAGRIVAQCWNAIPAHFPYVALDEFVVMPNHIHGIITVGAKNFSPLRRHEAIFDAKGFPLPQGTAKTIGSIVRGFKIGVTKWIRSNTSVHKVWQRNYWEHIIRSEAELAGIREYIQNNPAQWELDKLHQPSQSNGNSVTSPTAISSNVTARAKNFSPLQNVKEA